MSGFDELAPDGSGPYMRAFISTILADDLRAEKPTKKTFKAAIVERVQDIEAGYDLVVLASEIGCSMRSIEHYLSELQIARPKRQRKVRIPNPKLKRLPSVAQMIADIRSGVRPSTIAKGAGTTPAAVYRDLGRAGFRIERHAVHVADFIGTPEATNKRIAAVEQIEAEVEKILEGKK